MEMNLVVLLHRFSSFTIKFIYDNIDMSCSMDLCFMCWIFSMCRYGYGFWCSLISQYLLALVTGRPWNQTAKIYSTTSPLISYVTFANDINSPGLNFFICEMEIIIIPPFRSFCCLNIKENIYNLVCSSSDYYFFKF